MSYTFKYLGWWLCADGDMELGLERRMEAAADRFRELGRIWWASEVSIRVKLRVYVAGVLSVLLYGCECWWLDSSARSKVGAWNARRLAVLTGRTIKEEYQEPTRDVVKMARLRRLTWLGKVLNRDSESIVTQFILAEANRYNGSEDGHIFNDVPSFTNSEELVSLAQDTDKWSEILGKV